MRARIILALAVALFAAGCGQRGPLYLRENPPPGMQSPPPQPYQPVPYPRDTRKSGPDGAASQR